MLRCCRLQSVRSGISTGRSQPAFIIIMIMKLASVDDGMPGTSCWFGSHAQQQFTCNCQVCVHGVASTLKIVDHGLMGIP